MPDPRCGVSTHLFHEERLSRDHLAHIAAHGFELVEVFATRAHFDYRDPHAVAGLAGWLADTRLELHSLHAPAFDALRQGRWVGTYSTAAADEARRRQAVAEVEAALQVAADIPFRYLVLHVGVPSADRPDNQPQAARRSVEEIVALASTRGVRVALEVIPNALSTAPALVDLIEEQLDGIAAGICLDYGHAHLLGDVGDAIETVSGHLWTTHIHDNAGRRDDHLVPYAGTIDWEAAMMATRKIGYDGALILEVGGAGDPADVLARAVRAREKLLLAGGG